MPSASDPPVSLAVLAAAGTGARLGSRGPKALVDLDGVPLVARAAHSLVEAGIRGLVVTAPPSAVAAFRRLVLGHRDVPVLVAAGGASRQDSVRRGLDMLPELARMAGVALEDDTVVLIHDAARCLTPAAMVRRVIEAVRAGHPAVVPGLAVSDTLKEVAVPGPDGTQPVTGTPQRADLRAVQTPQGFTWSVIKRAHDAGAVRGESESSAATDDAALVEDLGIPVVVVEGDVRALKITTRLDLALASLLLEDRSQ